MTEIYVVLSGYAERDRSLRGHPYGQQVMETVLVTTDGELAYRQFEKEKESCLFVDVEVWRDNQVSRAVWFDDSDEEARTVWA